MPDVHDVIQQLRAQLGPHGERWQDYGGIGPGGRVCLLVATGNVISRMQSNHEISPLAARTLQLKTVTAMIDVITEQFPERIHHAKALPVVQVFNDHRKTNWPDITLVLDKVEANT